MRKSAPRRRYSSELEPVARAEKRGLGCLWASALLATTTLVSSSSFANIQAPASQACEVPESVATENVATADAARNASEVSDANNAAATASAPTEETSSPANN
jgi:hypothetical protein